MISSHVSSPVDWSQHFKQVIVVRVDLNMSKGKLAGQVAHASVWAYDKALTYDFAGTHIWLHGLAKKIICQAPSDKEIREIGAKCDGIGIPFKLVYDAGLTEIPAGTLTAIGIGPVHEELINKVTGNLKLLK